MNLVTLATCNLNQWALDFEGNLERIAESIRQAKAQGASYRLGPELEISGYGCEDAFLEADTIKHSWEVLAQLLDSDLSEDILCDIGMPLIHKHVRYNCRVFILNRRIHLIRPKMALAQDGNYREARYFARWTKPRKLETFSLPNIIRDLNGQYEVPIGDGALASHNALIASETCEELFTPASPHIQLGLDGIEIIGNGSGSHHELRKLETRLALIQNASKKNHCVYLYANQQGCDGGRLYYDGCALIAVNGKILAQGSQFSLKDVEVISAHIDLDELRSARAAFISRMTQASEAHSIPRVNIDFSLEHSKDAHPSKMVPAHLHSPEEEIALGPAAWLWDYLRRSNLQGFFVPLSGGADSSSVVAIVGSMCQLLYKEVKAGNEAVLKDLRRITHQDESWYPSSAKALASDLLYTCYMGSEHSSKETRQRAKALANDVGSYHLQVRIDRIIKAWISLFSKHSEKTPRFAVHGGSKRENLALQNIQARSRMVLAYFLAQLLLWTRGKQGSLLVLGTSNVDEGLRGYMTKYDASSADINPIGSISKLDLRRFLSWATEHLGYKSLKAIAQATPTAELEPLTETHQQKDEDDMGMTYEELAYFGRLRKIKRYGPASMFERLCYEWDHLSPDEVAEKVKRFFFYYAINRHKATVLTPSYHAENYSPDDHRFDLRQFLYNARWTWQFKHIDKRVKQLKKKSR